MKDNNTTEDFLPISKDGEKLVISKRDLRGDDGYKVFSVRIKDEIVAGLDNISHQTNRSRNELIGMMLEFAIKNCEIAP